MTEQEHMNKGMLKEKLGSYQVDPPEELWDAISGQIGNKRKRRGMYILILATAASFALLVSLGIYFFGPDLPVEQADVPEQYLEEGEDVQTSAISTDPEPPADQVNKQVLARQEPDKPEGTVPELSERDPEVVSDPEAIEVVSDSEAISDFEVISDEEVISDAEPSNDLEVISDAEPVIDPVADLLPDTSLEMNTDPFPLLEEEKKRDPSWMVGAAISPLYSYRDADAVAMPSNQAESGLLSYSTGVHVRYRRNSRLAFETGIYYNRTGIAIGAPGIRVFSQSYDNMIFGYGSESADINDVSNSVGNIVAYSGDIYMNGYKLNSENGSTDFQSGVLEDVQYAESGIQQHLDYLELPFNLRYSVIDRTFELQLVGGLSTNFLVGNSVTMEGSSGKEEVGYLTNVNTVNYSGNAGLGMIYHMGRKMSLFLEPRFRYFLNSVNDATLPATRPYSLGFYTGLSYTF